MSVQRVASAYAKSILVLSQEIKSLDVIYEDMIFTTKLLSSSFDLRRCLSSPVIPSAKKIAIIDAIFSKKVNKLTSSFFLLISKKGREDLIQPIANSFIEEYKILNGIRTASVSTAVKVNEKLKKQIESVLSQFDGAKLEVEYKIDPSLIGGIVLSSGDRQYDSSVKSKLSKIKNQFNSNPYISKN